jgi:hypothetical protein
MRVARVLTVLTAACAVLLPGSAAEASAGAGHWTGTAGTPGGPTR